MKAVVYLRIARTKKGVKIDASEKVNYAPLKSGSRFLPTIAFGIELDLSEDLMKGAGLLAGILTVNAEDSKIAAKIPKLP